MVLILTHLGIPTTQFGETTINLKKKKLAVSIRLNIGREDLGSKQNIPKWFYHSVVVAYNSTIRMLHSVASHCSQ